MQLDEKTTQFLDTLKGVDLTTADGRLGISVILAEVERLAPEAILQRAASIELRRIGFRPSL